MAYCVSHWFRPRLFGIVATTLLLASCTSNTVQPPEIVQDRTACTKCKMLVSETQYAAGYYDGEAKAFDDIGCMMATLKKGMPMPQHVWVKDLESNEWLDARKAVYVYSPKQHTPMDYGYIAIADGAHASQFVAQHGGRIFTSFDRMLEEYKASM